MEIDDEKLYIYVHVYLRNVYTVNKYKNIYKRMHYQSTYLYVQPSKKYQILPNVIYHIIIKKKIIKN